MASTPSQRKRITKAAVRDFANLLRYEALEDCQTAYSTSDINEPRKRARLKGQSEAKRDIAVRLEQLL